MRRDTRFVPAAERPSDDDGLRMIVLARRAKRQGFELRRLPPRTSVLIEDLAFNAILAVANRALTQIARELDQPIDPAIERDMRSTEDALDQLWDEPTGQYYPRDVISGELIKIPTVATLLPLWAEVPSTRAHALVERLRDGSGFWPSFPVPSVPTDAPQFDPERYWKGPTWVNMNWMIIQGLRVNAQHATAAALRRRTLDLVEQSGPAEYFSPIDGRGFGADEFSWTAALVLDLLDAGTA